MRCLSQCLYLGELDQYVAPSVAAGMDLDTLLATTQCEISDATVRRRCSPVPPEGIPSTTMRLFEMKATDAISVGELQATLRSRGLKFSSLAQVLSLVGKEPGLIKRMPLVLCLAPLPDQPEQCAVLVLEHDGSGLSLSAWDPEEGLWGVYLLFAVPE